MTPPTLPGFARARVRLALASPTFAVTVVVGISVGAESAMIPTALQAQRDVPGCSAATGVKVRQCGMGDEVKADPRGRSRSSTSGACRPPGSGQVRKGCRPSRPR